MFILLLFGLIFFIGGLYNFYFYHDNIEAWGGLLISSLLFSLFFFIRHEKNKSLEFLNWLFRNKTLLDQGTLLYNGERITKNSEVVQFEAVLSFLVFSTKISSRFYLKTPHNLFIVGLAYSFITLLFGLWAIPHGPIWTIKSIMTNLRGGKRQKILDLLGLKIKKINQAGASLP